MKEILITSSVMIAALLLLRLVFAKKVSRTLIYGVWILVALRLLVPVQIGQLDFSVLTAAQPVTEFLTKMVETPLKQVSQEDAYADIVMDYIEKDQSVFVPEVQVQIEEELRQGSISREDLLGKIQQAHPEQDIFVPAVQQQVQQQMADAAQPVTLGQIATVVWLAGVAARLYDSQPSICAMSVRCACTGSGWRAKVLSRYMFPIRWTPLAWLGRSDPWCM